MFNNRSILVGISLVALLGAGVYLSKNTDLAGLVDSVGQTASPSASSASSTPITSCAFETDQTPWHIPIIVNEIAWMGNATSSNDEWIELRNVSSSTVPIGGWELENASGKIKIVFRSGAKIPADGLYLLLRGSKDFLPGVKADNFFVGILKNTGDSFRLFDRYCSLIDEAIASSGWPAGDNATKRTMERDSKTFSWYTSSTVGGTPRAVNDAPFVAPQKPQKRSLKNVKA